MMFRSFEEIVNPFGCFKQVAILLSRIMFLVYFDNFSVIRFPFDLNSPVVYVIFQFVDS